MDNVGDRRKKRDGWLETKTCGMEDAEGQLRKREGNKHEEGYILTRNDIA